jgi:uncharacterized protein
MTTDTRPMGTTGRLVPLRPGMFSMPDHLDQPVKLLGSRCAACREMFFPQRAFCANCSSADMREVKLATQGSVETYTIVRQRLNGSAMVPPYAIVRVALDGGPTLQTVMVDCDPEAVRIGDRVAIVAHRIMDDEAGNTVVSFVARPLTGSQPA